MKELIKSTLLAQDFGLYQTSALVIFFTIMMAVLFWIHRPGTKSYYRAISEDAIRGEQS